MRGVAQDCEPMIHDWPARCSMVTANQTAEVAELRREIQALRQDLAPVTRQLSGALRPLERPVRPCHQHRPTWAPHQADAAGMGAYQPRLAKQAG